jgi:stigma-specific protein Stig1
MDGQRFDRLAQILVTAAESRRTGIRLLLAGGLQLALAAVGRSETAASERQRKRKKCKAPAKRCGKHCVRLDSNPKHCGACHTACPTGKDCQLGACFSCGVLGTSCIVHTDCCQGEGFDTSCAPGPACDGIPAGTRCCRSAGFRCSGDCDCCSGLTCTANHRCG